MRQLIDKILEIKKSNKSRIIAKRMSEFNALGKKPSEELFKELCFCILTANFRADKAIEIQKEIGQQFLTLPKKALAEKLKKSGCRFHTKKAGYIVEARKHASTLGKIWHSFSSGPTAREWFVKNIKGLGYKESSHFLRNVGYTDVAIIDFHIIDLLARNGLIKKPKTKSLTKKSYLSIENVLKKLAKRTGMNLGELDLYLWYIETGKVLK